MEPTDCELDYKRKKLAADAAMERMRKLHLGAAAAARTQYPTESRSEAPDCADWGVARLKRFLRSAGISHAHCVEKAELVELCKGVDASKVGALDDEGAGPAPPAAGPGRTPLSSRTARCASCSANKEEARAKGDKLQLCRGCLQAAYCSPACQEAAWPAHKAACKAARAADQAAAPLAAPAAPSSFIFDSNEALRVLMQAGGGDLGASIGADGPVSSSVQLRELVRRLPPELLQQAMEDVRGMDLSGLGDLVGLELEAAFRSMGLRS
jgi:hypothetical protein